MIYRVNLTVTPLHNVVLPTLSSKVIKYLIASQQFLPELKQLVLTEDKYKPIFISNLRDNERIFLDKERGVKANTELKAFVSFYSETVPPTFASRGGIYNTPYGKFAINIDNIKIIDLSEISKEIEKNIDKNIKATFKTPVVLSPKLFLPPSLKDKFVNISNIITTLPPPGLISAYAYNLYCSILGKRIIEEKEFKLATLVNGLSIVTSYNMRPLTVDIGKNRKNRGAVGWIEFDIVYEKLKRKVMKYLLVASYLGLGKGRGIGLGETEISFLSKKIVVSH